jgi:MSHA biogenesis protein MshG
VAQWHYTGRSAGAAVSGQLEGASAGAVAELLLARGVVPLNITASRAAAAGTDVLAAWRASKVSSTERLLFARQLHTLLRAGVPILAALRGLQDSCENPQMRQTLQDVRHSLESGQELSLALAQHPKVFDGFYIAMVKVGEMTGRLDEVFKRLFEHMEFEIFMRQQVKSALRYPAFVVVAMVAAIAVINLMVVPAFAEVFKSLGSELPWATRLLIGSSEITLKYGWLMGLSLIGGALALRRWVATKPGRLAWDHFWLRIPLAGKIVQKATLARFARSFALALRSGVPVERALAVVAQTADNQFIASRIEQLRLQVERGDTILRSAAASGIFTPVVLQMIAVGEETGAVDELMDEVASLYGNDVQYELKTLSQQIEPILVVFLGIVVLILALGVFLPMWDLGRVAFKK